LVAVETPERQMLEQAPQLLVVVGFAETLGMAAAVVGILEFS
jgi:hypothetical protein